MVEVVTVAVVMGTLVRMAIPNFHDVLLKARAAEVLGDYEAIRVAVLNYHAEHHQWPDDAYTGQIPSGLEGFLPDGYTFDRPGYRMDWENWVLPDGLPRHPDTGVLVGISVVTDDRELGVAIMDLMGNGVPAYNLGTKYTFVVERM
jgi:hypothetical protein